MSTMSSTQQSTHCRKCNGRSKDVKNNRSSGKTYYQLIIWLQKSALFIFHFICMRLKCCLCGSWASFKCLNTEYWIVWKKKQSCCYIFLSVCFTAFDWQIQYNWIRGYQSLWNHIDIPTHYELQMWSPTRSIKERVTKGKIVSQGTELGVSVIILQGDWFMCAIFYIETIYCKKK